MEFLIIALILIVGGYFGWQYYQAKKSVIDPYVNEVVNNEKEVAAPVEAVKTEPTKKAPKSPAKAEVAQKRTRKNGKFAGDDKSTPDVNEAFKDGKAPAKKPTKKKPTMKIAK